MKRYILFLLAFVQLAAMPVVRAQEQKRTYLIRVYDDNDLFSVGVHATDAAYTNGTRIDAFYTKEHRSGFFVDRWLPHAGDSSINIFGVGVVSQMYTPAYFTHTEYQDHDYNFAGALVATHTLYSYNRQKKYDLQTEIVLGVMGPIALGKQLQRSMHTVIADTLMPHGWGNQFNNDALINVNFTVEKQLFAVQDHFLLLGTAQLQAGTMTDAIDISPEIRIGKMVPYFNGYMSQYKAQGSKKDKWQAYFRLKPGVQFVAWNSLLEGGMFSKLPLVTVYNDPRDSKNNMYRRLARPQIENVVTYLSYGVIFVYKCFSFSYSQTHTPQLVKGTYTHTYGNISLTYGW